MRAPSRTCAWRHCRPGSKGSCELGRFFSYRPRKAEKRPLGRFSCRFRLLLALAGLDDRKEVARRKDEVLISFDLHLGPAVLRIEHAVTDLHVHRDPLAVLETTGADGDDLALLRLLLGRVGDDDPRRGLLRPLFDRLDDHAILERLQTERHEHPSCLPWPSELALPLPEC